MLQSISVQELESQTFQTSQWYQGCSQEIVISPDTVGVYDFSPDECTFTGMKY